MISPNDIITESLGPAVAITGIALLLNGISARFSIASTRVRELNRELLNTTDQDRIANIQRQIPFFMERVYLIRNAMFILFGALGMLVFTAVSIALAKLHFVHWEMVPVWSFLSGLLLMLIAVILEAYETTINLRTLDLDVDHSFSRLSEQALNAEQSNADNSGD